MSGRGSTRSGSSIGGYETPDEEFPPAGRSVQFVEERETVTAGGDERMDEMIDRKSFRYMKRPKLGKSLLARIFRRFPRCYAIWCGMIFPLWFLVLLSLIGGRFLGDFEFDEEVNSNDNAMRLRLVEERYNGLVGRLERYAPALCHIHYKNEVPPENLTDTLGYLLLKTHTLMPEFIEQEQEKMIDEGQFSIQNLTSFSMYLNACGEVVHNLTSSLQNDFIGEYETSWAASRSLSFNWIRCVNVSWTTPTGFNRVFQPTQKYIDAAHPANQSKAFSDAWLESQKSLQDYYSNELEEGPGYQEARLKAFNQSNYEATGGSSCAVNVPSAGTTLLNRHCLHLLEQCPILSHTFSYD
jgi:hypothetical protein